MASEGAEELEKPPITVCRHCATRKPYENGNTSSMAMQLKQHHPGVSVMGAKSNDAQQQLLTVAFKQPFAAESDRAKAITKSIGVFIAADMMPYSIVENKGFKSMVKVLEPRYEIPLRTHRTMKIMPDLYDQEKNQNCLRIIEGILCCPHHRWHYLHGSTTLDPRFKSLSHLDPALCQRTYCDLTTEIVGTEEGQATEPTGADSEASLPQKKSAMQELFGETFASKDTGKTFANIIEEEVAFQWMVIHWNGGKAMSVNTLTLP
eukprot:superscaffoldBa00000222_g2867